jgi:hypothetical protein
MSVKYLLKTDHMQLEVSKRPVLRLDDDGRPRVDRDTKFPVYLVELTAFTNETDGSVILPVSVPSADPPELEWRQPVEVVDLEIIPWASKDRRSGDVRSGTAFRAAEIRPLA